MSSSFSRSLCRSSSSSGQVILLMDYEAGWSIDINSRWLPLHLELRFTKSVPRFVLIKLEGVKMKMQNKRWEFSEFLELLTMENSPQFSSKRTRVATINGRLRGWSIKWLIKLFKIFLFCKLVDISCRGCVSKNGNFRHANKHKNTDFMSAIIYSDVLAVIAHIKIVPTKLNRCPKPQIEDSHHRFSRAPFQSNCDKDKKRKTDSRGEPQIGTHPMLINWLRNWHLKHPGRQRQILEVGGWKVKYSKFHCDAYLFCNVQ